MSMDREFENKVALVTGASRGIGRAIALGLAKNGAAVVVNYQRQKQAAEEVVSQIKDMGMEAVSVAADVADYGASEELVRHAVERFGRLDILVNNAGVAQDNLIVNMAPEQWRKVIDVNLGGVFNCSKAALAHFMPERRGCIVNVSSVMGKRGWVGESNYAASKAAINAFTQCCAVESVRFGIRVNAVLPGFSDTDMVSGLMEEKTSKGILKQIPMKRFANPDEISELVCFLASERASYITGEMISVDGGVGSVLGVGKVL